MKAIIKFLFIISIYYPLQGQNIITGKIIDQKQNPISGVQVFISEVNKGTISDSLGYFKLNNLPNGKFKIQFSALGYKNRIENVYLKGEPVTLNHIVMEESILELEEIVVSGIINATQHENAVKIDVLKMQPGEIKNTPSFTEMIAKVPGVSMISKGSGVTKPVIRGLSMNDILTLNNGVRFENYQYSSHHPLGIDEFGIEDVEVIKGPASLLYGSDAIGGVINFIKEKPAPIGNIMGDYNLQLFSNSLGYNNNIGIKGSSKKFFGGIRVGQKNHADYLQGGGTFVPNTRFNEISLKTNAGFTDKIGSFKIFYDYNNEKIGLVEDEAVEQISKRGRKNEIYYQEFNTHLLSSQNKLYFGNLKLNVNAAYQTTELIHFGDVNVYELQMKLSTLTYETKLYLPSNSKSDYILGFQGFNQKNTNLNDRETILLPDASTNNYAGYAFIQHTFGNKFTLQSGLRYDYKTISTEDVGSPSDSISYRPAINKNYGSFSGSVGYTYQLSDNLILRNNVATAYRTPNLAELTSKGEHELRFEVGDENLVPENSIETDISLHWHKNHFIFDIAGFYNIVNNYIFITPTNDTTTNGMHIYRYKQANSYLYGGETGLHIHPTHLEWLHFETNFSYVVGKQKDGNFLPFIPAHRLNFEIRLEKQSLLFLKNTYISINTHTAFKQNNPAPDETPTKGYSIMDMGLGGNIVVGKQEVFVGISVNNIMDTKYIDHLSLLKEVGFYNPGRNFTFYIKIPFVVKTTN